MAKIAFFEIEDWEKEIIRQELKEHTLKFFDCPLNSIDLKKIRPFDALAVFIYSHITSDILAKLPKVKLITTMSTGFDHIGLEACKKRNIAVCNVPTYGENTVAEHTFGLILALSRKIYHAIEKTKKGDFTLDGTRGFDLKGKTLGVVGAGNIGQHVIRIAKGFEMNVMVSDPQQNQKLANQLGFTYAKNLNQLLAKSDIITLHAPYNAHTHHLINKTNISKVKKGALLINTARGGLVQTEALAYALQKGILKGAGLDVLEGECYIKEEKELLSKEFPKKCDLKTVLADHLLCRMDNVLITPHSAFNSQEALLRILHTTIENIKGYLKRRPINKVQ